MRSIRGLSISFVVSAALVACGQGPRNGGGTSSTTPPAASGPVAVAGAAPPPPPSTATPPCVISADCPSGEHCDLGECLQSCNSQEPCTGGLACSPRGRCMTAGQPDKDPTPSAQYGGAITASPMAVQLTDRSAALAITLTSTSKDLVQYRVQLDAPHLSIGNDRGSFTGTTTFSLPITTANLQGHDVPGTVKVFTTLGDVTVSAPIHVGMTGSYTGALRYDAPSVSLGDARIALDLLQDQTGEVSVRIQSQASLLFPATGAGEVTGHGQYSQTGGLDFTVVQVVDPSFGAERNHFRRSIGRSVHFLLQPDLGGNLSGTFTETIVGLFAEPVKTTGTASLQYLPTPQDPGFTVAADPALPAWPGQARPMSPTDVFGWNQSDCADLVAPSGASLADALYSAPLYQAFAQRGANPIEDYAGLCRKMQQITSMDQWAAAGSGPVPNGQSCGLVPPLACALAAYAQGPTSNNANAAGAVQLVNDILAPSLLIAKDDNVTALTSSFTQGTSAELQHYNDAMAALAPAATWVLQPLVLEYLRNISAQAAEGSLTSGQASFPAARALSDLFYTSNTIDGERARIGAAAASGSQPQLAAQAQQRALLGYLEGMSLVEIASQWGTVPPSVTSHLAGMLTPLDSGFAALVQGANAFGVPAGYVPFVYSSANASKAPTNFEQMLAIAGNAVSNESNLEQQFVIGDRQYEANEAQLQQQLSSVRTQYDLQVQTICGATFNLDSVTSPAAWQNCGANNSGTVGTLGVDAQIAQAKVADDKNRIEGQKDKIKIDVNALAQTQSLDAQNVEFISSTGESLSELDFLSGMLTAAQQAIQVASNAQVWNFGAPLAEASVTFMLGAMQASITTQKDQLETAQTMEAAKVSSEKEYVDGMANIQKETIDLAQMSVDMIQDQLEVLEKQVQQANLVEQAKGLFTERQQVLAALDSSTDPLDDPTFRLMTDQLGLQILAARADAQQELYLSASALQYEINQSLSGIDGAVLNASNNVSLTSLSSCLLGIYNKAHIAYGTPQTYTTTVSIRQMLGITGPRTDSVTGQTLSEADQFQELLLRNENLDGLGGVGIAFSTDLQPGNGLWATDVCNDRILDVQAQLVGDFLGDNEAQVNLSLTGGSVMRACDAPDDLVPWSLTSGASSGNTTVFAAIQGGVNTFGEAPPNTSLYGQSVARSSWRVVIPSGSVAPANVDVTLTNIQDIVLRFDHQALPIQSAPLSIDTSCLAQIGGGQ